MDLTYDMMLLFHHRFHEVIMNSVHDGLCKNLTFSIRTEAASQLFQTRDGESSKVKPPVVIHER